MIPGFGRDVRSWGNLPLYRGPILSHGARISSDGQEAIDKEAEEHLAGWCCPDAALKNLKVGIIMAHMLHVWYIYLQNWVISFGQMLGFIFQHHGSQYGWNIWLSGSVQQIHGRNQERPAIPGETVTPWLNVFRNTVQPAIGSAGHGAGMGQ